MTDDPVATELAALLGAREEACTAAHGGSATEKPLLTAARLIEAGDGLAKALGALDAVLKLAAEARTQSYTAVGNGPLKPIAWDLDPEKLRAAILAALTGKEKPGV